jgi:recombination protein RecT
MSTNTQLATADMKGLTLRETIETPQFSAAVGKALPKHLTPDRFIRVACTTMMRTPKLAECDRTSFLNALLTCSQLGIEPDGRRAHLIPFNNRKRGIMECQLIIDYKGLAELAMRSGIVANLHADKVCDGDEFEFDRGQIIRHRIDFRRPRGEAYAFYAIARFKDGTEKCEVMTLDEVDAIRKRSRSGQDGPWVTDFDEMAKKTVFRRLSKWLPLSPEFRDAVEADDDLPREIATDAPGPKFERPMFDQPPGLPAPTTPAPTPEPRKRAPKAEKPAAQQPPADEQQPPQATPDGQDNADATPLDKLRGLIREFKTTEGQVVEAVLAFVKPAHYGLHEITADVNKWPEKLVDDVVNEFGFIMDAAKGGDA